MSGGYAAFKGRSLRGHEGKWHLVDRESPRSALDEQNSLCGRASSNAALVKFVSLANCQFCLKRRGERPSRRESDADEAHGDS